MICIVFQRLSRNLLTLVFVFAKKLTRISLAIMLVPSPSGNTKLAYLGHRHVWKTID